MKSNINHFAIRFRTIGIITAFIITVFACSKSSDTPASADVKYCTTTNWSSTIGVSGFFKGATTGGDFYLTAVNINDAGDKTLTFQLDNLGHLVNDQSEMTFTYDQNQVTKIVASDGAGGSGTFNFDANKHLTSTNIVSTDQPGTSTGTFTYTYDSNDDPVKIVGHVVSTDTDGQVSTGDYDITADYLTDKASFIPLIPEIVPFSIYFAYGFYLSKHLINKWVITITVDGKALTPFTQSYEYKYDKDGRVSTMVHTGNKNNIYTFKYAGCN